MVKQLNFSFSVLFYTKKLFKIKIIIMAKPIKETPVLTGVDARVFAEEIARVEEKIPSTQEFEKMKEIFYRFDAIVDRNGLPR
jgi:hypothetical protein